MSSLAGALDGSFISSNQPTAYTPSGSPAKDVEMRPHNSPKYEQYPQDEEMTDLFGNDDDVEETKAEESAASPAASGPESDRLPSPERERRQALEYEEEDAPPEIAVEVKEAEVAFPNIPVPKSSDGDNWVIRMPNFVKVDSKPFHPDTYIGPEHDDDDAHQAETLREKSMTIKLKVENTVRWRWRKDEAGIDRKQSNSRIIRWSDGTLSLRLGKELFDINQSIDTSGAVPRQSLGGLNPSQSQIPLSSQTQSQTSGLKSQGLTYLVAQHKRSQVLQAEAVITGYMSLRPTGMQSETHRMLVRAVGQKHNKVARLRMAPDPTTDPEKEKLELIKQTAKKSKKKIDVEDGLGGTRKRRYSRKTADRDVWSDDDDDIGHIFGASDEDDDGMRGGGASKKAKKRSGDDDRKGEDYQEDDFVVADSDEDDDFGGGGRKKGGDDDELDKLDAEISAQEEAKRRRQQGTGEDDGEKDAEGMDVESEEEDDEGEEFKVRRAGGSGIRKRPAVSFNDEEEEE